MTVNSHIKFNACAQNSMHARRTVVLQLYSLISVNIFWYFMHMRGKTICEFTVIIEYPVERTDSGRQSRFWPREQMLAWVVDWPSPSSTWGGSTYRSLQARPVLYYDLGSFSIALPNSNQTFCMLNPSARTHTAAPHCGSHGHQPRVCLTLQFCVTGPRGGS